MIKIKSTVLAATVFIIGSMVHATEIDEPVTRPPMPRPPVFMVEYVAGPSYLPGKPFSEQPGIMEHAAYMDQLYADSILIFGGPFFQELDPPVMTGAALFLDVGTENQAREIADRDPAITNGFLTVVDVKPFMVMIGGN